MRNKHSLLQPLAAAALCAIAFSPVAAQTTVASTYARNGARATPVDVPVARTVAIYMLEAPRNSGMPVQVTVADSAGQYTASYKLRGSNVAYPMTFEMRDSDIILAGKTAGGTLTLTIRQKDEFETPSDVIGRWALGRQTGELLRASR